MKDNNSTVSDKLQEIFELWTGISEEGEEFYKWPFTVKEIKRSREILNEIEKIPFDDLLLKERFEEMKKLVHKAKSFVPDYPKVLIRASVMLAVIIVLLTVFFMTGEFKSIPFEYDEKDWIITERVLLKHSAYVPDSVGSRGGVILKPGDKVKPISRTSQYSIQVETENGERGYINFSKVSGAKTGILLFDSELFKDMHQQSSKDTVREGEKVRVLNYYLEGKDTRRRGMGGLLLKSSFSEIETQDGRRGFIYFTTPTIYHVAARQIRHQFIENIPSTGRIYRFPANYTVFENKIIGKNLEEIENIYGPAGSVMRVDGQKEAHLRHVELVSKDQKYQGVFIKFGPDGKAVSFETDLEHGRNLLDKLPLSGLLRKAALYNPVKQAFYYTSIEKGVFEKKFYEWTEKGFFIKIVLWGLYYILALLASFIFLSIPRFVIHPFILATDHSPKIDKETAIFIDQIMIIVAYYIFVIWLSISGYGFGWAAIFPSSLLASFYDNASNGLLVYSLLCVLPFAYWIQRARKNISYNKCDACRAMDLATDKGSLFLGASKDITWGTHDKLVGRSESSDTIYLYYERRAKKTTEYFNNYKDLRYCERCGNKWGIKRKVARGRKVQKL
jgi:hypothetical protein